MLLADSLNKGAPCARRLSTSSASLTGSCELDPPLELLLLLLHRLPLVAPAREDVVELNEQTLRLDMLVELFPKKLSVFLQLLLLLLLILLL